MDEQPMVVADVAAWRDWLDANEDSSDGVWLVLAKKGTQEPTSLSYAEALDEALCSGWIDGQKRSRDAATFLQRFTPRRRRSLWSQRNVEHVARLIAEGRMRPRGHGEIERAQQDGRWERAYAGSASAQVPADLMAALEAAPTARAAFEAMTRQDRFSVLHPLMTAPNPETRARRLARIVEKLDDGAGRPG
ncbi:YdeI family protein [Actinotalea sp.]|uniref:YdeI/OmpD-associated family protein n=1 Tax=Actinotalea sp. TaxID=1872145 RepID=UPI0035620310